MSYKVGQVLFVVSSTDRRVIPVQIAEKIRRETLDGESISYTVNLPTSESKAPVDLARIKGQVYENLGEVKRDMLNNASSVIEDLIQQARNFANNAFNANLTGDNEPSFIISAKPESEKLNENLHDPQLGIQDFNQAEVMLQDGTVARVNLVDTE